jgi:hypothetical protein
MSDGPTQKMVADALRTKQNPINKELKPLELRARGYQLYAKEQQAMGETPVSYEQWMKSQE